jgi:hypothetical protein
MSESRDVGDAALIGSHCSLPTCHALDFLPLTCAHCHLLFCSSHSSPSSHACSSDPQLAPSSGSTSTLDSPSFRSLLPDRSASGVAPASAEQLAKQARKEAALAVLHKNFPSTPSTSTTSKPKKVHPRVALMQLRQRAKPLDPTKRTAPPMPDRVHLHVLNCADANSRPIKEAVWVSKV